MSNIIDKEKFPMLASYAKEMLPLDFDVNGRDLEIELIQDTFARAMVSNIFLLGDAGVGKTTLVRSMIKNDPMRRYLEIDLTKMTSIEKEGQDASTVVAERMQALLDEVEIYGKMIRTQEGVAIDLVLFIDEFHLLPKLSEPAVEAMKPALADSVNRGIRVIAATTFDEYVKYNIEENQPFIERFVQVKLDEPSDEDMLDILKQTSDRILGVGFLRDDSILRMIIEMTNRYIPASSQPRKGLMMFDAMVGAHRNRGLKFDKKLLADTIYNTIRVNIAFRIEAQKVEEYLNNRVYDQRLATKAIEMYLQVVIADLYDKSRPMASFLLTGSTGVGKTELCKALATVMFGHENKLQRYDMSEYSEAHRVNALREDITNGAKRQAYGIILLDEIEKAHSDCTRLLLQVLDDARLSDRNGREVSFKNMYIIATTNVGSATYESIASYLGDDGSPTDKAIRAYKPLIRRALTSHDSFPTELVNRFNAFIPFVPLADRTKNKIAKTKLDKIKKEVEEKHGLTLKVGGDVATWLVYQRNESAAKAGGGRGIANTINEDILAAVSRAINLKLYDEKTRTLWMAVDPDVTTDKIALKKDLQFTYGGSRVDESTVYIGSEKVARALIKKNELAIKAWKQRVLKGLQ